MGSKQPGFKEDDDDGHHVAHVPEENNTTDTQSFKWQYAHEDWQTLSAFCLVTK